METLSSHPEHETPAPAHIERVLTNQDHLDRELINAEYRVAIEALIRRAAIPTDLHTPLNARLTWGLGAKTYEEFPAGSLLLNLEQQVADVADFFVNRETDEIGLTILSSKTQGLDLLGSLRIHYQGEAY